MIAFKGNPQFSDPSFRAFHHSKVDVPQPTGARTPSVCSVLPLEAFVERDGGWLFFPQVQEASSSQHDMLQPINQIPLCDSIHIYLSPPICSFPTNSLSISAAPQGCSSPNYSFSLRNMRSRKNTFLKITPMGFHTDKVWGALLSAFLPLSGAGPSNPEHALQHTPRACLHEGEKLVFLAVIETMQMHWHEARGIESPFLAGGAELSWLKAICQHNGSANTMGKSARISWPDLALIET